MKKYKILECLENLPVRDYRAVSKILPKLIEKSNNTFWNYAKIEIESDMDIPYTVVVRLEHFFKLKPGELSNVKIECQTIDEALRKDG